MFYPLFHYVTYSAFVKPTYDYPIFVLLYRSSLFFYFLFLFVWLKRWNIFKSEKVNYYTSIEILSFLSIVVVSITCKILISQGKLKFVQVSWYSLSSHAAVLYRFLWYSLFSFVFLYIISLAVWSSRFSFAGSSLFVCFPIFRSFRFLFSFFFFFFF